MTGIDMEVYDEGPSASAAGSAREAKEPPLGEWKLSLRRLRLTFAGRVDLIIVLLNPSPKREHFKLPILISRHEHFFSYRPVDTSHLRRPFPSPLSFSYSILLSV